MEAPNPKEGEGNRPGPNRPSAPGSKSGSKPNSQRKRGLRLWIFETIFEHDTVPGRFFDVGLLVAIVVSIGVVMAETVASIESKYGPELRVIEWVLTGLFTAEYLTRLFCHPRPAVYGRSFFGLVDLLAILPTYIAALVPGAQALVVVRMLRLVRVFRILKLAHFVHQADDLATALKASLPKIIVFAITVVAITTISGSVMYLIEGPAHGFDNIPRSVYWAIVTLTTVGYGDISPQTPEGQFVSSIIMIMGYGVIAVPTGIVSAELARTPARVGLAGQCCTGCGHETHGADARFCKICGTDLRL